MGGAQVPTCSLIASANETRLLRTGPECREGAAGEVSSGQVENQKLQHFIKPRTANRARCTLNYPTNIFSLALFLIGFTVQNAEVCCAFFFQKFQTATLRALGCLAAVLCFPGFQLSIETPHLPTYFYRKPI